MMTAAEKRQAKKIAELNKRVKNLEQLVKTLCSHNNINPGRLLTPEAFLGNKKLPSGLYAV
jgi:hypothetical protein